MRGEEHVCICQASGNKAVRVQARGSLWEGPRGEKSLVVSLV